MLSMDKRSKPNSTSIAPPVISKSCQNFSLPAALPAIGPSTSPKPSTKRVPVPIQLPGPFEKVSGVRKAVRMNGRPRLRAVSPDRSATPPETTP